jgi:hypothetical protein
MQFEILYPLSARLCSSTRECFRREYELRGVRRLVPATTNVSESQYRSHLLFQVEELPRGAWPLTVTSWW